LEILWAENLGLPASWQRVPAPGCTRRRKTDCHCLEGYSNTPDYSRGGMTRKEPLIQHARAEFHKSLLQSLLTINEKGVPSNADKDNRTSVTIASGIAQKPQAETGVRGAAQTSGNQFEDLVAKFVRETVKKLPLAAR
jgi:hypothetical protein